MPLIDLLLPNASADVVAVLDSGFNQVFGDAHPMKATVNETSKAMEHPVETGATITDHRIILPIEIELSLFLTSSNPAADYRSVYQQIKQLWQAATLLTVQTRTDSYSSMIITDMPHDEASDMFDAIMVAVKLKEVVFVSPQYGTLPPKAVANKKHSSTVKSGEKQTKDVTETTTSGESNSPSSLYGQIGRAHV